MTWEQHSKKIRQSAEQAARAQIESDRLETPLVQPIAGFAPTFDEYAQDKQTRRKGRKGFRKISECK